MKRGIAMTMGLLLIALVLSACVSPSEKIAEGIVEGLTGQSVDISGDSMTIKGEDGNLTIFTDGKWPKGKMGDLPELKGKVLSALESEGGCAVTVEDVKEGTATAYLKEIKDLGYAAGMELTNSDGTIVFTGTKDKASVMFSYSNDGTCLITYGIEQ